MGRQSIKIDEAIEFEDGKRYWVLIGDKDHEPTPENIKDVKNFLNEKHPKIKWIVTPYYVRPVTKRKKMGVKDGRKEKV